MMLKNSVQVLGPACFLIIEELLGSYKLTSVFGDQHHTRQG